MHPRVERQKPATLGNRRGTASHAVCPAPKQSVQACSSSSVWPENAIHPFDLMRAVCGWSGNAYWTSRLPTRRPHPGGSALLNVGIDFAATRQAGAGRRGDRSGANGSVRALQHRGLAALHTRRSSSATPGTSPKVLGVADG